MLMIIPSDESELVYQVRKIHSIIQHDDNGESEDEKNLKENAIGQIEIKIIINFLCIQFQMIKTKRRELTSIMYQMLKRQILKEFCCWWKKLHGCRQKLLLARF